MGPLAASFTNCIVYGSLENEIGLSLNDDQDYGLQEGSPAIDAGKTGLGITTDITGTPRDDRPDISAFAHGSSTRRRLSLC